MKDRLLILAQRAGLTKEEVEVLVRRRRVERIVLPVVGLFTSVISTIIGFFVGTTADPKEVIENSSSYPFVGSALLVGIGFWDRNRIYFSIVALITVLLSVFGYSIGYDVGRPVLEMAIEYGVYRSE